MAPSADVNPFAASRIGERTLRRRHPRARGYPMIPVVKAKLLEGKRGLIVGIANEQSIAWGCAKAFRAFGAELAVTYLNDKARKYVEPLARELEAPILMPLDVRTPGQMEAVFERIAKDWGKLDFVVHSIAFSPKDALQGRVVDVRSAMSPPSSARRASACTPSRPDRWRRGRLPASPNSMRCSTRRKRRRRRAASSASRTWASPPASSPTTPPASSPGKRFTSTAATILWIRVSRRQAAILDIGVTPSV